MSTEPFTPGPMRRIALVCVLLISSPAWAHSPGAMLLSVGLIAFLAFAGGFGAKRALVQIAQWEVRGPLALVGVTVAEFLGLLAFWFFFIARTDLHSALWLAVAGYLGGCTVLNALALGGPVKILGRLGRAAALVLPVPVLALLFWFGLLEWLYVLLGG